MTVIADNKKRVTLPTTPGERFDVQVINADKFVLTRLVPADRPGKIRLVKRRGYLVAVGARKITQAETRELLDKFP